MRIPTIQGSVSQSLSWRVLFYRRYCKSGRQLSITKRRARHSRRKLLSHVRRSRRTGRLNQRELPKLRALEQNLVCDGGLAGAPPVRIVRPEADVWPTIAHFQEKQGKVGGTAA